MFYNTALLTNLAKQLALLANSHVPDIARAVAGSASESYPPEITGAVLGFLPHLLEKAIITNPVLPGDVSAKLGSMVLLEFEAVLKITCNAGGFSNPIKKALFNTSFHTMFKREYNELKPKIDGLWHAAREEQQQNPLDLISFGLLKYCENSSGLSLESDAATKRVSTEVQRLFRDVHAAVQT